MVYCFDWYRKKCWMNKLCVCWVLQHWEGVDDNREGQTTVPSVLEGAQKGQWTSLIKQRIRTKSACKSCIGMLRTQISGLSIFSYLNLFVKYKQHEGVLVCLMDEVLLDIWAMPIFCSSYILTFPPPSCPKQEHRLPLVLL